MCFWTAETAQTHLSIFLNKMCLRYPYSTINLTHFRSLIFHNYFVSSDISAVVPPFGRTLRESSWTISRLFQLDRTFFNAGIGESRHTQWNFCNEYQNFTNNFITARYSCSLSSKSTRPATGFNDYLHVTDGYYCSQFHTAYTESHTNMREKNNLTNASIWAQLWLLFRALFWVASILASIYRLCALRNFLANVDYSVSQGLV